MSSQSRPWNEYQDKILKYIRDQQGVQKWSTIAQKMAEQYNLKGRNGKQCKQRYMDVFDQNKEVLHWDYQTEQAMFLLHDKLGNKWAAIGHQLNDRSDNDVKNHFYSKIRKGLRKVNHIVKDRFKKDLKEIKQTVLYKVIEGAEDRFSASPVFDLEVWNYCTEAKNCLLRMSYDEEEYNPWESFQKYSQQIKDFIENLYLFSKDFQRKSRAIIKGKQEGSQLEKIQGLQTHYKLPKQVNSPHNVHSACESEIQSCEIDQSHNSHSQDTQKMSMHNMNITELKRMLHNAYTNNGGNSYLSKPFMLEPPQLLSRKLQKVNPVIILKSSNDLNEMMEEKSSGQLTTKRAKEKNLKQNEMDISGDSNHPQSLLPSIPKLVHISSKTSNAMIDQSEEQEIHITVNKRIETRKIQFQLMKDGLLEEEDDKSSPQFLLFNGSGSKKITSKGSNFSSYSMDEEQGTFFGQDSTLNMRIFTTGIGGKMPHYMGQSIEKSDKLFKSLERSGKLFESLDSRGKRQLQMSIERSGDLNKSNTMTHSVGR